ncbi:MAG: GTPase, partial [Phycisphaerae bacterium]
MSEAFATLVSQTREWFERAHADGWLTDSDLKRLASLEQRTPADLFADAHPRPLVVAFFGGTGVGKSSLLNRLAGEPIARTGVERPTSREVTIYLHESVELATLPPELPVEHVRSARHRADARREVLWIDAPDIDSAHEYNRKLALAWLPHVDLLVYVVSPERYRDDVGWRVLRQRGHKHGWMFVLNRWDEGDASQKQDFGRMLRDAGFNEPLLLCTSCAPMASPLPTPDEFDRLETAIRALLAAHGVRELERLGHRARLLEMRDTLNAARRRLGDGERWRRVHAARELHWQRARTDLLQGLEWPIRAAAGRLAIRQRGLLGQVVR